MGAAGEEPEFDIKPLLGTPHLISPRAYLLKSFQQGNISAIQWEFEISVSLLIGELPKAIERYLPFASHTAGKSDPPCGLQLGPSHFNQS